MERIQGYVVGQKSIRNIQTWVIKATSEEHPLFEKKLLVASIAEGVALASAISVDFVVGDRNGSPVAVDVAPRGIKEQGRKEMAMSNRVVKAVVALSVVMTVVLVASFALIVYQGPIATFVVDRMLRNDMVKALTRVEAMPFEQMVTADAVSKVVKDDNIGVYAGKKVLLERDFCRPVFGESYSGNRCWWALYYGNTDDGSPNESYAKRGIPATSAPIVNATRNAMLEKSREYLRDPQRLKALYVTMKSTAVAAFRSLPQERRELLAKRLDEVVRALEHFYDPDVQAAYVEYIQSEEAWRKNPDGPQGSAEHKHHMELFRVMWDEKGPRLGELTPDYHSTLFAGRRHAEGGKELVVAWTEILKDAQASIK